MTLMVGCDLDIMGASRSACRLLSLRCRRRRSYVKECMVFAMLFVVAVFCGVPRLKNLLPQLPSLSTFADDALSAEVRVSGKAPPPLGQRDNLPGQFEFGKEDQPFLH